MKNERRKRRARRGGKPRPSAPIGQCPFPEKRKYTHTEAKRMAMIRRRQAGRFMRHYRCPAKGHWHLSSGSKR